MSSLSSFPSYSVLSTENGRPETTLNFYLYVFTSLPVFRYGYGRMYICVYSVGTYTCYKYMCVWVFGGVFVPIGASVYVYIPVYVWVYVRIHVYVCTCVWTCMSICVLVCICVYVWVQGRVSVRAHVSFGSVCGEWGYV